MNAIIENTNHYHMPDYADWDDVAEGMTVRQALKSLRKAGRENYGSIGTMTAQLSDNSRLYVDLQDASGGGYLMSSQRIIRLWYADMTKRYYKW